MTVAADDGVGSGVSAVQWRLAPDGDITPSADAVVDAEGETVLQTRAIDAVGHASEWRSDTIRIDRIAPVLTLDCGTADWRSTAASCVPTADGGASGLASLTVAGQSVVSGAAVPIAGDGEQAIAAVAVDGAGNRIELSRIVRVDRTPPAVTLACAPTSVATGYRCVAGATDADAGVGRLQWRVGGGAWTAPAADGSFAVGSGRVEVQAVDRAGLVGASAPIVLSSRSRVDHPALGRRVAARHQGRQGDARLAAAARDARRHRPDARRRRRAARWPLALAATAPRCGSRAAGCAPSDSAPPRSGAGRRPRDSRSGSLACAARRGSCSSCAGTPASAGSSSPRPPRRPRRRLKPADARPKSPRVPMHDLRTSLAAERDAAQAAAAAASAQRADARTAASAKGGANFASLLAHASSTPVATTGGTDTTADTGTPYVTEGGRPSRDRPQRRRDDDEGRQPPLRGDPRRRARRDVRQHQLERAPRPGLPARHRGRQGAARLRDRQGPDRGPRQPAARPRVSRPRRSSCAMASR